MFFKLFSGSYSKKRRIYLDYAAATPVDRAMIDSFGAQKNGTRGNGSANPAAQEAIGNPGALHAEGVAAKKMVAGARARVATAIRAQPDEIIFTPSATYANNLAIIGTIRAWIKNGSAGGIAPTQIEIVTTELEHPSVLEPIKALQKEYGITVTYLAYTNDGLDIRSYSPKADARAVLITCMYVHNELGVILPLRELAKRVRFLRKEFPEMQIVFHSDATQAPNTELIDVQTLGIDVLSVGSTKLYTVRGAGFLYKKRLMVLEPLLFGGNQEFGLVPGTEALSTIDLFSRAFVYAQKNREKHRAHFESLQTYFEHRLTTEIPSATISDQQLPRSPHITHISIPQIDSEVLVLELDARGIAVSSQSACTDEVSDDSYMKKRFGPTTGLLRFSFGRTTTKKDLDDAIDALKDVLKKYSLK